MLRLFIVLAALIGCSWSAYAGVVNPNISLIGTTFLSLSDDSALGESTKRPVIGFQEAEIVFDAALNPYAHGVGVFSFSPSEGADLEEAYFVMDQALWSGFALKAGKYRVGFGRLNVQHPHALPFGAPPALLTTYLPGGESFNEIGLSASQMLPNPFDIYSALTVDYLAGNGFHPQSTAYRPAGNARLNFFIPLEDPSALDVGVSAAYGTNDPAAGTQTILLGGDAKLKLWTSERDFLQFTSEAIISRRQTRDSITQVSTIQAFGLYGIAEYRFATRYNVGLMLENFGLPTAPDQRVTDWSAFAGLALMEETTMFRLIYNEKHDPQNPTVHSIMIQALFSMGPHKPHPF